MVIQNLHSEEGVGAAVGQVQTRRSGCRHPLPLPPLGTPSTTAATNQQLDNLTTGFGPKSRHQGTKIAQKFCRDTNWLRGRI